MKTASSPSLPMAVLDLGSNATRLLVGEKGKEGIIEHLFTRVPLPLGQYCYSAGGKIPPAVRTTLIDVLNGLRLLARSLHASHYRVVATAAIRDCKNCQTLQAVVLKQTGLRIDMLSGEEEAAIIGAFVAQNFPQASVLLNVDAGGGSTDCSIIVAGKIVAVATFDVGTARLRGGKVSEKKRLTDWLRQHTTQHGITAVASGGSVRALASICGGVTDEHLIKFIAGASRMTPHNRAAAFSLTLDKAHKIVPAARICRQILQAASVAELKTTKGGLGEAVLAQMLLQPDVFGRPLP